MPFAFIASAAHVRLRLRLHGIQPPHKVNCAFAREGTLGYIHVREVGHTHKVCTHALFGSLSMGCTAAHVIRAHLCAGGSTVPPMDGWR